MASKQPLRAVSIGTRLILILGLSAILVGIGIRLQHARMLDTASAKPPLDMHEASAFVEDRLAMVPAAQKEQETLRYAEDSNAALRYAAIDALMKVHSPAAVKAIEQAFSDSASEVRKRALEDLIQVDKPRGLRLLLAGLHDEDSWIREDAAAQLNIRIGHRDSGVDKQVVPMLMTAITDPNEYVASTAIHALCRLTGNPWRFSVLDKVEVRGPILAKWQEWWQTAQQKWPASPQFTDVPPQFPTRADPAPAFNVDTINGGTFRSDDLKGKVTLINFWGTWCAPCKAEIPALVEIAKRYRSRNVAVVGLTVAETSAASVQTWCRSNDVTYPQALATEEARRAFGGIEEVPVSFLIDTQGRVRYQWDGDRDFGTFQAAIERLLREPAK